MERLHVRVSLCALIVVLASAWVTTASSRVPTKVVPIYVFAGQSNMVGWGTSSAELAKLSPGLARTNPNAWFYGPTDDRASQWGALRPPTEVSQASSHSGFGPEVAAAGVLAHPGAPIAIVKLARSGTDLFLDWDPARNNGMYHEMVGRARAGIKAFASQTHQVGHVAAFFWMQGESDAENASAARSYERNLTDLIKAVRKDLVAPHLLFVIGRISSNAGPYARTVRDAQLRVALRDPYATLVGTDDLRHVAQSVVHLDTKGEIDLGWRFARALH